MKKIILLFSTIFLLNQAWAQQSCMPDMSLPDTLIGVIPLPFEPEINPGGGIQDTACINTFYETTLTVVIPSVISLAGAMLPISSIDFDTETAIGNLPEGLDYVCNPPTCIFEADSIGCVSIFGTVTDPSNIGMHDLTIAGQVRTVGLGSIGLTFPDDNIFPGNYFLFVREEGTCISSADEIFSQKFTMLNRPNPFQNYTDIVINAQVSGEFAFEVYDVLGKQLHRQRIALIEGQNTIPFDGNDLANGIYLYSISDGQSKVTKKMIVNRN